MAKQGVIKQSANQHPIIDRGDKLLELTKILRNIKAEKETIKKNQLSATKSDGTDYVFLEKNLKKWLDLDYREKQISTGIERLKK